MTLRIGSLFSGYGGLDLAVQAIYDAEHAWFCEFDPAPSRILARHWPDVPNLEDVTAVDWATVEPIDILTGGFPCQDVSVAGRRAGMTDGTRSGLWSHMAHAIDILRPQLVVIENVGGLFSATATSTLEPHPLCLGSKGTGIEPVPLRAIDAVLSTLSEVGYDAEWVALRASDVGAPHGRLRVFITAHPAGNPAVFAGHVLAVDGQAVGCEGAIGVADGGTATRLMPTPGANLGTNGGPQHPDKRRAGGHSVSIEDAVHGLVIDKLPPTPVVTDSTGTRNETAGRRPGAKFSSGRTLGDVAYLNAWGDYAPAIARWKRVLGRQAPEPTEPGRDRPRLSARFVEWLMGLEDGHVTAVPGLTRPQQLKALGNGVVPQQGAAALAHLHSIRSINP